jgi:hypothetical protein
VHLWACPRCHTQFNITNRADTFIGKEATKEPEEKQMFTSGAVSTKKPRFDLIPVEGLIRAADRFELGLWKYKNGAYNARGNQKPLLDKEWLIARASHGIDHLYKCIRELQSGVFDEDDNAGAVAWCGLILAAARTAFFKQRADFLKQRKEEKEAGYATAYDMSADRLKKKLETPPALSGDDY